MAFQPEVVQYDTGVYQLETTDPVDGGVGAVSNKPLLALANRTAYLKKHIDDLESGATVIDMYAPKASPTLTGSPTAPTQASGDNSTKLATDAFVQNAVNGGVAVNVAGGSTTTLTQAQYGPAFLILQGAITAAKAVVFPAQSGHWQVVNSTTGAFALTLKTASGTGVVIAPGKSMNIYCDGTNIAQQQTHFSAPWITDGLTASGTVTLSNTLVVNDAANFASTISVGGEIQTTNINSYRHVFGNYGYFWRNDGTNMWLMLTNSQDQYGSYNGLRPLRVQLADGKVVLGNTLAVAGVSTFDSPITANGQIGINTNGSSTSLLVTDTGVNGANIKLVGNGTATPSKYIRVNAGILQILNDNYSASLMTLNESGSAWFAGNVTAVGSATINTTLYVKGDTTLADGGFIFSTNTLQIRPSGMNAGLEIGDTRSGAASTPFIDFHSGATAIDYDFRIIAGGGNGSAGGGYISMLGASLFINPVTWFYKPVNVEVKGTSSGVLITGDAGQFRMTSYRTSGSLRWETGADYVAESGSNVGSNWFLNRFADDGSYVDTPILVNRSSGVVGLTSVAVNNVITMPTQARTDSSTKGANTAFVKDLFGVKGVATRFTSNGTWTCPVGINTIYIYASGGGGGGGGGGSAGSGTSVAGGGGGGGAGTFVIAHPMSVTPGATYTITIGAGGAAAAGGSSSGGPGQSGGSGGTTSIAIGSSVLISLAGGSGGAGGGYDSTALSCAGGGGGLPGGGSGSDGQTSTNTRGAGGAGGMGASSPFGSGGGSGRPSTDASPNGGVGTSANGYGGGGGGGGGRYALAGAGAAGGSGSPGIFVITY